MRPRLFAAAVFVLFMALCAALQAETVVLRFSATWCGPCREMRPAWDAAKQEPGIAGARIVEVDVDTNKQAVSDWKVGTIPACVIVETRADGSAFEVGRLTGRHDRATLMRFLKTHLEVR